MYPLLLLIIVSSVGVTNASEQTSELENRNINVSNPRENVNSTQMMIECTHIVSKIRWLSDTIFYAVSEITLLNTINYTLFTSFLYIIIGESLFLLLKIDCQTSDIIEKIYVRMCAGLSLCIVFFSMSSLVGPILMYIFTFVSIIGIVVFLGSVIIRLRNKNWINLHNSASALNRMMSVDFIILLFFAFLCHFPLRVVTGIISLGNYDAALHTFYVSNIIKFQRLPILRVPLYGFVASHPLASHAITAHLSWIFKLPTYRGVALTAAAFTALIPLSVYYSAKKLTGNLLFAIVSAIVSTFLSRTPIRILANGGLPFIMGLFLVIGLLAQLPKLFSKMSNKSLIFMSFWVFGSSSLHPTNFILITLWFITECIVMTCLNIVKEKSDFDFKVLLHNSFFIITLVVIMSLPMILHFTQIIFNPLAGLPSDVIDVHTPSSFGLSARSQFSKVLDFNPLFELKKMINLNAEYGRIHTLSVIAPLILMIFITSNWRKNHRIIKSISSFVLYYFIMIFLLQIILTTSKPPVILDAISPKLYRALVIPLYFLTTFVLLAPWFLFKTIMNFNMSFINSSVVTKYVRYKSNAQRKGIPIAIFNDY